jgi:hypothetical protein
VWPLPSGGRAPPEPDEREAARQQPPGGRQRDHAGLAGRVGGLVEGIALLVGEEPAAVRRDADAVGREPDRGDRHRVAPRLWDRGEHPARRGGTREVHEQTVCAGAVQQEGQHAGPDVRTAAEEGDRVVGAVAQGDCAVGSVQERLVQSAGAGEGERRGGAVDHRIVGVRPAVGDEADVGGRTAGVGAAAGRWHWSAAREARPDRARCRARLVERGASACRVAVWTDRPLHHLADGGGPARGAEGVHAADGGRAGRGGRAYRRCPGRRVLAARGRVDQARPAREARAAVPVREPGSAGGGSAVAERIGAGALRVQDAVARRHHARGARTPGLGCCRFRGHRPKLFELARSLRD